MKIIISPAKTFADCEVISDEIKCYDIEKTNFIHNLILENKSDLSTMYKCSQKIVDEVVGYISDFSFKNYLAGSLYNGIVYKQLQRNEWSDSSKDYYNDNVIILDALYGQIKPTDIISKYRLDFLAKIGRNLYKEWNVKLNDDLIINLASKEFSVMITEPMFNVDFFQIKNNKEVAQSTECKKMRGKFLNWLITNKVNNTEEFKTFNIDGYKYFKTDEGCKFIKD